MDPAQCMTAIDEVRAIATFVVVLLTVGAIVAMGNLVYQPKASVPARDSREECKLHSRKLEDCTRLGMHDNDDKGK